MESKLLEMQDIIRNGLMSVHKTLTDAHSSLAATERRVNQMMESFQGLVDGVREHGPATEADRNQDEN